MTTRHSAVLLAALAVWVLAAGVYGDHRSVRVKLLRQPQPPQPVVSFALPDAPGFTDPYAILIYRLRNFGPAPVAVTARLDEEVVEESSVDPGESSRIDLAVPRAGHFGPGSHLTLTGTPAHWAVEYAELANIHGFTRGLIDFVILPPAQPFSRASPWLAVAWALWCLCLALLRQPTMPRWLASLHLAGSFVVGLLFAAVALAPWVSDYRLVLASHTFLGGLVVVAAPRLLGVTVRSALCTARRPAAMVLAVYERRARLWQAITDVPWLRIAMATALVLYAAVLWRQVGAYAGGADSSGYLNGARLLSEGTGTAPVRSVAGIPPLEARNAYEPLGFHVLDSGGLAPTYPVGLSLLIAGAASVAGWSVAADIVMVLHALAGVMLTFGLARECRLSARGASIAALILATTPLYLFMSLTLMSDTPSLAWVTAGVLLAWRSRQASWPALAAGAAVGVAVLIRPTNILAVVPIAICFGAAPRRWLLLAAGGAPAALFLAFYNQTVFGSPLASGYVVDYDRLFDLDYIGPSLRHYATWLPVLLTPVGVLFLGLPALLPQAPRLAGMLLAWGSAFAGFYAVYFHTHETWWYLRFLLPAFPALIVGSLWVGAEGARRLASAAQRRGGRRYGRWAQSAAAAALVAALVFAHHSWWARKFAVLDSGGGQYSYVKAADWAKEHLPADAAVLAMQVSGTLFYYTDFPVVRWDNLKPDDWRRLRDAAAHGGPPIYAILFPFEIDDLGALRMRVPGNWVQVGTIDHVTVWQLQR